VATAAWEQVEDVAGGLLARADMYPERYRVRSFPTDQQLTALADR
jgi:hypothetical protein